MKFYGTLAVIKIFLWLTEWIHILDFVKIEIFERCWKFLNETEWKMKIEKIFLGGVWIYQNLKSDFISSDHSQGQKFHFHHLVSQRNILTN